MYKIYTNKIVTPRRRIHKFLLIMRLTTVLLIAMIMQVSAGSFAQSITLRTKNASLSSIMMEIHKQSGYDFFYNKELIKNTPPVSINVKNASIEYVLNQCISGLPLTYKIDNKAVLIKEKQFTIVDKVKDFFAAPVDVTGRVVDLATGDPLSGCNITVKGESKVARTGPDGTFILRRVEENAILVVTRVGYRSQEISAAKDVGTIRLDAAVGALQEVGVSVNTGYQRIKPEQSTGATSTITTKEFESRISTSFLDGLVNRLPGLLINNDVNFTSTTPGTNNRTTRSLFAIRGISTMSANQSPLIVIDGFPTELTMDMIDPNEIKSVTILKDAAAATVYGVRASNGVLVIERKQARAGKPVIAFRATTSVTPKQDYSRYRTADDASAILTDYQKSLYSKTVNAGTWALLPSTTGITRSSFSPVYYLLAQSAAKVITPEQAAASYAALQNYDNSDEYAKLFLRNSITQTYNLNASGGNENALYYITGNFTTNRLEQIKNNNNKILLSARTTLKLSKRLSLELTTDYLEQRLNSAPVPAYGDLSPNEHLQDVNGNPLPVTSGSSINPYLNSYLMTRGLENSLYYPLIDLNEIQNTTHTVNNRFNAQFGYLLGSGFDISLGGTYETSRSDYKHYATEASSEVKNYINQHISLNTDGTLQYNIPKGGYLQQEADNTSTYTVRAQINYNKKLGSDHSFNGIIGSEVRDVINKSNLASYFGYNDQTLLQQPVDYNSIISGITRSAFGFSSTLRGAYATLFAQQYQEDRYLSGYANLVYTFKNRYSLTGSARIDQSNLFGTNPKYKYKPLWSIGAGWNIDKEDFMTSVSWVNQLKLRGAYGFNGNVAKLSLPQAIASSVLNNYTSPASSALQLLSYANSSLRWEQTRSENLGLEYKIFKNVNGTVDYYKKRSTDLLGSSLIDPTIGVSPSVINQATIENHGIEISVHADWIKKSDFNWNTGLILAHNASKVLDVYQKGDFSPQTLNAIGYVKGYPVGALFAYRDAGLNNEGFPQIKNSRGTIYQTNNSMLGSAQTAIMASDTSDVSHYVGTSIPSVNAGLSNRVDFGNFYIFAMINYYGGFKVRVPRPTPISNRPLAGSGNYWRNPGDENTTDIQSLAAFSNSNSNFAYNYSDRYVVNGDYITLGDLTFSYSLDHTNFIKKSGFKHFEIKAQGSNLWSHGFNRYNYSPSMGSFQKSYVTPTYTVGIFTNL